MAGLNKEQLHCRKTYLSELAEVRLDVFHCRVGAQSTNEDLFRTRYHLK